MFVGYFNIINFCYRLQWSESDIGICLFWRVKKVYNDFSNLVISFIGCKDFLFPEICLSDINLKRFKTIWHRIIADIRVVWLSAPVFEGWNILECSFISKCVGLDFVHSSPCQCKLEFHSFLPLIIFMIYYNSFCKLKN